MESLFFNLLEILSEQNKIVNDLLKVTQEHNIALRENRINNIISTIKNQEKLVQGLKRLDHLREEIEIRIARELNIENKLTLSEIMKYSPPIANLREISQLAAETKENLAKLNYLNELNKILSNNGLIFVQRLQNLFQPRTGTTYQGSGRVINKKTNVSTINKSI